MCIGRTTPYIRRQIIAESTTTVPKIVLPWMLRPGIVTGRVTNELRELTTAGTFTQEVRYRYAPVITSLPGAWLTPGTPITRTAVGSSTDDVDLSAGTANLWVQFALFAKNSSGVGYGEAGFGAQGEGTSRIIGARTIEWNPTLNTSSTAYLPIGGTVPTAGLTGLMFAVIVSGVTGTITFQPAWRTFEAMPEQPNAWTTIGISNSDTGNDVYNSDVIAVAPGSTRFAQAGLAITTAATATLQVIAVGVF